MTNKIRLFAVFALLAFAIMACFITDTVGGTVGNAVGNAIGGDTVFNSQTSLWTDVPRMDGFASSNLDLPLFGKLLMQTMMSQFLAQGKGGADWIVFTTNNTVDAIQNFYTNATMAASGWEASEGPTCFSGSDQGITQVGLFCVFTKQEGNTNVGLMLITAPDEKNSNTNNVFFIRIENKETTPTP